MTFDREQLPAENWIQLFSQGCTERFLFGFPASVSFSKGGERIDILKCTIAEFKTSPLEETTTKFSIR